MYILYYRGKYNVVLRELTIQGIGQTCEQRTLISVSHAHLCHVPDKQEREPNVLRSIGSLPRGGSISVRF